MLDFDSTEQAGAAFDTVEGWISTCDSVGEGRKLSGAPTAPESVPVPAGGTAVLAARVIFDDDVCNWQDGCDGWFLEHQGVAMLGTRVVVFSWVEVAGLGGDGPIITRATDAFDTAISRASSPASGS